MRLQLRCLAGLALSLGGVASGAGERGYLPPSGFDILAVLPPVPQAGEPQDIADRAIFRNTRSLVGTPRWAMATEDVKLALEDLLRDFSCAAGARLTPAALPKTTRLLMRASADTGAQTALAKTHYHRLRPFQIDRGAICQPARELAGSFDYPSGHTTTGWTWATLLAELMPDRAAPLLARGRAFGESRVVCGVHYASAVEAGRVSAAATLVAMSQIPAFKADFAAAHEEVARNRGSLALPDAASCATEQALVAQPLEH